MVALVFNKCCFCIDLRVGCLIIGYLNLVAEVIVIVLSLIGAIAGGAVAALAASADGENKEQAEAGEAAGAMIMIVSIILLVIILVFFTLTIVLLVGVHQHKRGHIKAYLIGTAIILALYLIGTLASIGSFAASDIVSKLIQVAISIYFLLCVRSYYYKMDDKPPHYAGNA